MSNYVVADAVPVKPEEHHRIVEVVAPATLSEGYSFMATVNGQHVSVVVPPGGVKEGQTFSVPVDLPSAPEPGEGSRLMGSGSRASYSQSGLDMNAPRGYWKDGLCNCCTFGPCHPSLWNAICCPQLLMAQVLTRMNMSWLGDQNSSDSSKTFQRVFCLLVAYWVIGSLLAPPTQDFEVTGDDMNPEVVAPPVQVPVLQYALYRLINLAFGLYSLIVLVRLRRAVRDRYAIPTQTLCEDNVEDCVCAFCCGCCTVAQLARHTADYQERRALCCSSNGLPPSSTTMTPALVV